MGFSPCGRLVAKCNFFTNLFPPNACNQGKISISYGYGLQWRVRALARKTALRQPNGALALRNVLHSAQNIGHCNYYGTPIATIYPNDAEPGPGQVPDEGRKTHVSSLYITVPASIK